MVDNELSENAMLQGKLRTIALNSSIQGENAKHSFQVPLSALKELTVEITNQDPNPDTNVVMWDVTLAEANRGQKLLNWLKR